MIPADLRRRALSIHLPLVVLLGACAALQGPPRVTLSERDISRLLQRQFPQERRALEVFDVTLRAPQVRLLADRNRLGATLELDVRERLFGGRWSGQLEFDAALRWEPNDRTLRFSQPRVNDLKATSAGADVRTPVERLGAALAERVLEDMVLYTLPAERAEALRAAGRVPAGVAVTPAGVEITFSTATR